MFEKQILCRGSENISGAEIRKRLRISELRKWVQRHAKKLLPVLKTYQERK